MLAFVGQPFDAGVFACTPDLSLETLSRTATIEETHMRGCTYNRSSPARSRWARLLGAALVLTLTGATGCRIGDASGPLHDVPTDISGTYALADVGGNKLPTSIYQGPYTVNGQKMDVRIDVVASTFQFDATRYSLRMYFQVAAQGQTVPLSVTDSGSYSKTADVISFTSDQQKVGRLTGNIHNGDLKMSIDLVGDGYPPIYLFRK
jgi:anti-sigma28 factor (negative regulator of flagellin synthesis)